MPDLLSLHRAVMVLLEWTKIINNAFDDEKPSKEYFLYREYLISAIESGILPAVVKEASSKENRELMGNAGVPEGIQDQLPKSKTYWVSHSDLAVFAEGTSRCHTGRQWAHSRESLAKVCYLMTRKMMWMENTARAKHIKQMVEDANTEGLRTEGLGESTLKNCVREINEVDELMNKA